LGYDYEELYRETPDALGELTPEIVSFFAGLPEGQLQILDIGCGQGRDALFLARAGHHVTGVDLAPSGIRDLTAVAAREGLDVNGIVADIAEFEPDGRYDVVLIDRTLHMLVKAEQLVVLNRLLGHVETGGWCVIVDEKKNLPAFKDGADTHPDCWHIRKFDRGYLFLQQGG